MTRDELHNLKVGDRVRCINDRGWTHFVSGGEYAVTEIVGGSIVVLDDIAIPDYTSHDFELIQEEANMTGALTPADALRAMAENIDYSLPPLYGLQIRLREDDWIDPLNPTKNHGPLISHLVEGRVQIRHKPAQTPAQKAGWSVGDLGIVRGEHDEFLKPDTVVTLTDDDGSHSPEWQGVYGTSAGARSYCELTEIERLVPASECKE